MMIRQSRTATGSLYDRPRVTSGETNNVPCSPSLGRHPATGSPRHAHELNLAGLRSWPLTRYPFLVFYIEQADHIEVWRVLHSRRDIPIWMQEPDGV